MSCGMKPLVASFGRRVKQRKSSRALGMTSGRVGSSRRHGKCLSFRTRMKRRHRRSSSRRSSSRRSSSRRSSSRRSSSRRSSSRRSSSLYKMLMPWSSRRNRFGGAGDGTGGMGAGFAGPTSFQNGYASYFGGQEPFINASEFWYPNANPPGNKPTNYQSPRMISSYAKFGRRNKCCTKCGKSSRCRCSRRSRK
jgi:hypothetical protein